MGNVFELNVPTKIYYGRENFGDSLKRVNESSDLLNTSILVVTTGGSLYKNGYIDLLKNELNHFGQCNIFDQITANPKLEEIEAAIDFARRNNISTIVGFGGGSAIDAAKAVSAGVKSTISVTDMFRSGVEPKEALPIIAIPTTAGTGSELSKATIINDVEMRVKGGMRGNKLYPTVAIVDSAFTDSMPFGVTMETGFDVLAHAMESYVSKKASPYTMMLSEYVLRNAGNAIRVLIENLIDKKARDVMSYCSMLMGINLGNASTALPHRMQYPLGIHSGISHGAGLAMLYPSWIKHEREVEKEKIDAILKILGVCDIKDILSPMGLLKCIKDTGISREECMKLKNEVAGSINNDSLAQKEGIIELIYQESWEI